MRPPNPLVQQGVTISIAAMSLIAAGVQAGTRTVDQHQSADPTGTVDISNSAGAVEVSGWDRPEVEVTGTLGTHVDRVDLTSEDHHVTIRVVQSLASHWSADGEAQLLVHLPQASALNVSLASADLKIAGLSGAAQVRTVSGDVQLVATGALQAQVATVSGKIDVTGGDGTLAIKTVSGGGRLQLGLLNSFRLETVSGDFAIAARLAPGAQFQAQSVSGALKAEFSGSPGAAFDLSTLTGHIQNCTDPKPSAARFAPGSRLAYTSGDGRAFVQLSSKSGELTLCSR